MANYDSVTNGPEIVKKVMDKYGRIDVSFRFFLAFCLHD